MALRTPRAERRLFCASGVYTGNEAEVIPGVRGAVDRKDGATAGQQLQLLQAAIERGTATLSRAQQTLGELLKASGN